MKLTFKERICLPQLCPREGNLLTQTLVKDIQEKTKPTQEELIRINFRTVGNQSTWDDKEAQNKDVDFTSAELNLLKQEIDKLDKGEKITQNILGICLKIKEQK